MAELYQTTNNLIQNVRASLAKLFGFGGAVPVGLGVNPDGTVCLSLPCDTEITEKVLAQLSNDNLYVTMDNEADRFAVVAGIAKPTCIHEDALTQRAHLCMANVREYIDSHFDEKFRFFENADGRLIIYRNGDDKAMAELADEFAKSQIPYSYQGNFILIG